MKSGLLLSQQRRGWYTLALWIIGLFVLAVVLSATVRVVGTALVLAVGPIAVVGAVLAQLAGVRSISHYRTLFAGFVAAFFAVLLPGISLLTGAGVFSLLGFGASVLAAVAAILA